ncbi:MAG: hypothetical protein RI883_1548 [Bacteroidota bacterium]|jgi:gliding motility-associated-like protein
MKYIFTFLFLISSINSVFAQPLAIISPSSTTVCAGQSTIFNDASTGTNIDTWTWSFGSGLPGTANTAGPHSISFPFVGTFNVWLQISDDFGTDDTTIQINVIACSSPTAAFSISDNTICPTDCITFNNNSSTVGATSYLWTFNGGSPATSTSENPGDICYSTPGEHTTSLLVTNAFGNNTYSQNITVVVPPTITAAGSNLIPVDPGILVPVTATVVPLSIGTITWSSAPTSQIANLSCTSSDCSTADITAVLTTIFTATFTTSENCIVTDTLKITVTVPENGFTVGVPNMFSPDGNSENDVLYVRSFQDKLIKDMIFRVFNRYGQLVFESIDYNIGWDGRFNGKDENAGVFVYTLEFTLVDGTTGTTNGNVTLVR